MSPTSAPKPERQPKLRASCDACAASKVKCSKEHPMCARCLSAGSDCIYGISRKHGKPGRTRKRNPDGTPFTKASKQRPSPAGSEFGKFRICAEPLLPEVEDLNWPPTLDFEHQMTPHSAFPERDYNFMSEFLMTSSQSPTDCMQTVKPELTFRDPFARQESLQPDTSLPADFQALKDFIGGDSVRPMEYAITEANVDSFFPESSEPPQSPMGSMSSNFNPLREDIVMPTSHNCYNLAYSTLESLHFKTLAETSEMESMFFPDTKSLDSVLSVTRSAVKNVLQLLSCSCSSDPHLAMLYSSIASKILTWYQIAAGLNPAAPPTPALTTASSPSLSSSWTFSSGPSTPSLSPSKINITVQPMKIGAFEFDEADQEALRRQVVLGELKKCGVLVEALANWRGNGDEQAEFLYDMLGAWLKSELFRMLRDVTGGQEE
ncbi:uncharacterized protein BDR25DRAFT_224522 [Lindgomyces ingoldianus]|uniref:Uncharacterized protein n=1 Tax=Lindgomyces ingoldianus TaxID=673940 RepID=A0ACB6QXU8_9PLEO|nr:uncharacterized protein BDR25DRAFT_224522 [Lindgomyces ingoldianus]KAF2470900.1 hypothetical protein BDR25DRAFT_224522 [Lindgomyces ingoldianus]